MMMCNKKLFHFNHLDKLFLSINISDFEHSNLEPDFICKQLISSRNKWKACKKQSTQLRKQFLTERAELLAANMNTTDENALKSILNAEQSRQTFSNLKSLLGKQEFPLTQVEVLSNSNDPHSSHTEIENNILKRNQQHSRQALGTPFFTDLILHMAIDPLSPSAWLDDLSNGSFLRDEHESPSLSDLQREWIQQFKILVSDEISLQLSIDDFQSFFRSKQECTSSSLSRRHMGYYKAMLECIRRENPILPEIVITIVQISILTTSHLERWSSASQLMLKKGKGHFIEHLHIIQLCKAGQNFVLHVIWGHRPTRHALKHSALNTSQYALPGQTCHNTVLNKILCLDLSCQT